MISRSALWPVWGLLLALWLGSGCSKPDPPTIKPRSAQVKTVSAGGVTLTTVLDVHNPNGFPLRARKVHATVIFGGKVKLGPVDVPRKLDLPANKTTKLTVDIPTTWANAAQVTGLAASSPTIPYVIDGTVLIGGKSLNAKVPFQIKGSVKRSELIEAGLKGLPKINLPGLLP